MFLVFQLVLFTKLQLGIVVAALEATEDMQVDSLLRGACRANQQHLAVRGKKHKNTYDHFKLMKKFTQWGDWECRSFNEMDCMESSCMVYSWIEKWNGTTKVSSDIEQITTLFCFIPSTDSSERFESVGVATLSPPSPHVCPVMMRNPAKGSGCSTSKSLAARLPSTQLEYWHYASCDTITQPTAMVIW